jgi:hypothetical protein
MFLDWLKNPHVAFLPQILTDSGIMHNTTRCMDDGAVKKGFIGCETWPG